MRQTFGSDSQSGFRPRRRAAAEERADEDGEEGREDKRGTDPSCSGAPRSADRGGRDDAEGPARHSAGGSGGAIGPGAATVGAAARHDPPSPPETLP
ncbi:hypothetical protein GCM10017752_08090 [Streptomyces roseoviridis]